VKIQQIVCPISSEKIDSNVSRLTVFFNVLLMVLFIVLQNPVFIVAVTFDYFIRAFLKVEYSPLRLLAMALCVAFGMKKKPINLAQKVFASRLGFLCALAATICISVGANTAAIVITGILGVLSTLDSVFNFCVGCLIYNYFVLPFYKK
jgi:hypothetical protein